MNRLKKWSAVLAALALAAAACGSDGFEGQEIVVSYMQSGTYDNAARDLVDSFQEETGATVEVVAQPFEVLTQTYVTDLATGTGQFDLISSTSWIADQFPQLRSLGDLYNEEDFPGFIPELLQPGRAAYNGSDIVGIPYAVDAYGLFYRTDIFQDAGVSADWSNWEEFFAALDALQPSLPEGMSPFVFSYGAVEQTPAIWLAAYDSWMVDSAGRYGVDREPAIRALDILARTLDYAPEGAVALSIDEANAVFNSGGAAVLICWPSFNRAAANESLPGQWALGSLPGPGRPWLSLWNASIASTSDNPELVYEWIKSYINPANSTANMAEYGIGSPFGSTYSDPELLAANAHDYPTQAANLAQAINVPWTFPAFEVAFRAVGEMLTGSLTSGQVVDAWHEGWGPLDPPAAAVDEAAALGMQQT